MVGPKDKLRVLMQFSWCDGYYRFVLRKEQADGTADGHDLQNEDAEEEDQDEDEDEDEEREEL